MSLNDSEESQRIFALRVMCQSVPTRIVLCSSASKRTVVSVQEANSCCEHCSEVGGGGGSTMVFVVKMLKHWEWLR